MAEDKDDAARPWFFEDEALVKKSAPNAFLSTLLEEESGKKNICGSNKACASLRRSNGLKMKSLSEAGSEMSVDGYEAHKFYEVVWASWRKSF